MTPHPWLSAPDALVARVARARATAALRGLPRVPSNRLGTHAAEWQQFLAILPALLRTGAPRVLGAVGRVDVLPVLLELPAEPVDRDRLERALLTLWLAIAGHPGLGSPIAFRVAFPQRVVDPAAPRILAL